MNAADEAAKAKDVAASIVASDGASAEADAGPTEAELAALKKQQSNLGSEVKDFLTLDDDERAAADRAAKALAALADEKLPPWAAGIIKATAPMLSVSLVVAYSFIPVAVLACKVAAMAWSMVPANLATAVVGFSLAFVGGCFPVLLASVEAAKLCGLNEAGVAVEALVDDAKRVMAKSAEDDLVDDDHDGIADVNQITGSQLIVRKTKLVMMTLDPKNITKCLGCLYTAQMGIAACLRIKFAKTVALGVAIADVLDGPVKMVVRKPMFIAIPPEYHHWIDTTIESSTKTVAVSVAWKIERAISGFHSAIRGGFMCAVGILRFLEHRNLVKRNDRHAWALGFLVAAAGFYWQLASGFDARVALPFPFGIIAWPFQWAEFFIQYSVTFMSDGAVKAE